VSFEFANDSFAYHIEDPEGEERDLVAFYYDLNYTHPTTFRTPNVLPFPGCELCFCLKGKFFLLQGRQRLQMPAVWLTGQSTVAKVYEAEPNTNIFIVRLKQHVLKSYLQNRNEWKNTIFQLDDLFHPNIVKLLMATFLTDTFPEKMKAVVEALKTIRSYKPDDNYEWLQNVEQSLKTDISIQQLAQQVYISPRQLERKFKEYFDVTPAEYIRLQKLSDAVDHYARNADTTITDASFAGGFADQAHFIKIFKSFSNQSPLKFFRQHNVKKK